MTKADHGVGFLLCRRRLRHNTISCGVAIPAGRAVFFCAAPKTPPWPGLVPIGSTLMYIYLPIAEMSVNIFLILGMGGMIGVLSGIFGVGVGF